MRGKTVFAVCLSFLLLTLAACGSNEEAVDPATEAWTALQAVKADLDGLKGQLAEAEAALAAVPEDDGAEGDEGDDEPAAADGAESEAPTVEDLEAAVTTAQEQIQAKYDELGNAVVAFLNASEIYEGEELTPEQKQAFDMKAEIDIQIAQGHIDGGGNYKKAIDIYEMALRNNPGNELLLAAKAEAERLRYMDEERFALVEKGMTLDEVRDVIGVTMMQNRQDYPERNIHAWFYRKEDGGAAGVYFKASDAYFESLSEDDLGAVQIVDFDAIKPKTEGDEAG
ncbi:MAG: hypothetical protein AAGE94_08555 [Acidobacteriota bacterium]